LEIVTILLSVLQALLFIVIVVGGAVLGLVGGILIGPFYIGLATARYFSWLMPFGDNSDGSLDHI